MEFEKGSMENQNEVVGNFMTQLKSQNVQRVVCVIFLYKYSRRMALWGQKYVCRVVGWKNIGRKM